jgi:hypothetical protein
MKKIIYDFHDEESGVVYLTDEEFTVAMKLWHERKIYYCQRLEAMLTVPKLTKTEKERFFIIEPSGNQRQFFVDRRGELQEIIGQSAKAPEITEEFKKQLLTEDEYAKKYLRVNHYDPKIQLK